MNMQWDAETYGRDFSFVHRYGDGVAALIGAAPGSTVLDLGCGNGALTHRLRQSGFQVMGLDASPDLLSAARKSYPDIEFVLGDAVDFSLPEPVDVVFSNAVFHWIEKKCHPAMLACVSRALKPGGEFVFEFGGSGNTARIEAALERAFSREGYRYQNPFFFPTIGEYAPIVEAAGFRVEYAQLFARPTPLQGEDGLGNWIRMFLKGPFEALPGPARQAVIRRAEAELRPVLCRDGQWYADYVRLRMKARKL